MGSSLARTASVKHDVALLVVGLLRSCLWLIGAGLAIRERRLLPSVGFVLAAYGAIVFAFTNAHFHTSSAFLTAALYVSTPAVALIIAAFLAGTRRYPRSRWWIL
jgi:drug/metabolite transporter (DMT)-like permease